MFRDSVNEGEGKLHVASVAGSSAVLVSRARTPFRLLTPRARGDAVWAYTTSFGGGMVAGDRTRLEVTVDSGARCFLGTQSSTKIYRNPCGLPCSHELVAAIADNGTLVLLPDPVQCFADSIYRQEQRFTMAANAKLVLLDWMSAGRTARGERWSFREYTSRNEIIRGGQTIAIDALRLNATDGALNGRFGAGQFNCMATLILLGERLSSFAAELLAWAGEQPISPQGGVLFAASPLREGAVLRVAGGSIEQVGAVLHSQLGFLAKLFDQDPRRRRL